MVYLDVVKLTFDVHFVNSLLLTWIFWTAGAIAITVELGGGLNCSYVFHSMSSPLSQTNPYPLLPSRTQSVFIYCGQLNALEGFAWIIWYGFLFFRSAGD